MSKCPECGHIFGRQEIDQYRDEILELRYQKGLSYRAIELYLDHKVSYSGIKTIIDRHLADYIEKTKHEICCE